MIKIDEIKVSASSFFKDTQQNRRHLHQNPELSFKEYNTASYVLEQLKTMKVDAVQTIAETGIIAEIRGQNYAFKTVALRADLDALPIEEKNDISYKSLNSGVMHACGHDVHTANLLGAARILNQFKSRFEGTVKLIFQPGEEKAPGGASIIIKEGALENPKPNSMFGLHVAPQIPVGKVGFRKGVYMASSDEVYIKVIGKGGHAAMPDTNIDPIVIASHIIVALQQIVSRNANPKMPTVLSFGKIEGLGATNVIPSEVNIQGTFRTLNEVWRKEAKFKMKKMTELMAESMGAKAELTFVEGYPYLENEPLLTTRAIDYAISYLDKENVIDLDLWMASEDFAFYTHHVDACFYRLGIRNEEKGITSPVHTPTFDIDEQALEVGSGLMAWIALQELHHLTKN